MKEQLHKGFSLLKQEAALGSVNNILMAEQNMQKLQARGQQMGAPQGGGGAAPPPPQQMSEGEPTEEQIAAGTPQQQGEAAEFAQIQ
jgi:hypothetical protein